MIESIKNQRKLWEEQHNIRSEEARSIENLPNIFARRCLEFIPKQGVILEIGVANGRDARFFAKERKCKVIAVDFSHNAMVQLHGAAKRDATADHLFPVIADIRALPLREEGEIDAIYARSALHLSDEELDTFLEHCFALLKKGGHIMIEGKTEDDGKIVSSKEIAPNLYHDESGHVRRAWNEQLIEDIIRNHDLRLVEMARTTESIKNLDTKFIHFIAQK